MDTYSYAEADPDDEGEPLTRPVQVQTEADDWEDEWDEDEDEGEEGSSDHQPTSPVQVLTLQGGIDPSEWTVPPCSNFGPPLQYIDGEFLDDELYPPSFQIERIQSNNHQGNCMRALQWLNINLFKWFYFKWLCIVLNCVIEGCQAGLAQVNANGNINTRSYLKFSFATSFICLIISLVEMCFEMRESQVKWKRTRWLGWYYYPETGGRMQNMPYRNPSLFFGVSISMVQFLINFGAFMKHKKLVQFDIVPLLLSIAYIFAAWANLKGTPFVHCEVHGSSVAKCSRCRVEASI